MSNTPPIPQAPQPTSAKPTSPKEGRYRGKAVTPDATGAPHEFGRSNNGTPELLVHVYIPDLQKEYVTPLYFSRDAAPYSEERLRALGCRDVVTLAGIDTNEIDVEIKYDWFDGAWKMKVQILSGGGVFHTSNPMTSKEFAALAGMNLGRPINLNAEPGSTSNGGVKPPF